MSLWISDGAAPAGDTTNRVAEGGGGVGAELMPEGDTGPMQLPAPTDADIERIVSLVVSEIAPVRIVLFGSVARREQRDGSDLDLMVVMPEGVDRRAVSQSLYELMYRHRVMVPTQFVVATPSGFERHKTTLGMVYREIARDGREVYAA